MQHTTAFTTRTRTVTLDAVDRAAGAYRYDGTRGTYEVESGGRGTWYVIPSFATDHDGAYVLATLADARHVVASLEAEVDPFEPTAESTERALAYLLDREVECLVEVEA